MRLIFILALSAFFVVANAEELFDSDELGDVDEDDLELLRSIEEKHIVSSIVDF